MIYKDSRAHNDHDLCPAIRPGEVCINCKKSFWDHLGWACSTAHAHSDQFSKLQTHQRYLTQSMKDSIAAQATFMPPPSWAIAADKSVQPIFIDEINGMKKQSAKEDEDAEEKKKMMKFFSSTRPGHCKCDIFIADCKYHRGW